MSDLQASPHLILQLKKTTEGANLREVLGENLFLIRFPIMSFSDINDIVVPEDVLTDREGFKILRYLSAEKNKPEDLPFLTEPRFNPLQSLLIPAPYKLEKSQQLYPGDSVTKHSTLYCTFSRPIRIKTILVHAKTEDTIVKYFNCKLSVSLTQNGSTLLNYDDQPVIIPESAGTPSHYAVDGKDVRVKAGDLHMEIRLELSRDSISGWAVFVIQTSTISKLSDKFVSINFAPVAENLLLGIEYSLV